MGISGKLLAWLKSYLHGRTLSVVVSGQQSETHPITAGVPQGSILGPTLFLMYVNDAEHHLPAGVRLAVYADDTTVYKCTASEDNVATDTLLLQKGLDSLATWGKSWRIDFEPTKSQALTVSHHRHPWVLPPLSFDGCPVPEANCIKLLGVTFDTKLTFSDHIRNVASRANQRIYFFRKASRVLNQNARRIVYNGFIRPVLEYSPLAWMGACSSSLARLDAVQHRALKTIGPNTLLQSLAVRRKVSALCYLYKLHYLERPSSLTELLPTRLPLNAGVPATRQQMAPRHQFQLDNPLKPSCRNSLSHSFPYGVIADWNNLPTVLVPQCPHSKGLSAFKSAVYKHLVHENWLWATDSL